MEIEAKFAVPDRPTWRRLAQLRALAGFRLIARGAGQVADRYFDTRDGRLRRSGFACRLRTEGDLIVATLKGLGGAEGAVHRRTEEEVRLPAWDPDPATWPAGPARDLALELAGGAPLEPLFDLAQRRIRRELCAGERLIAQLSLDFVRLHLTALRRPAVSAYYELEVELAGAGQEADLAAVVAELSDVWQLPPEPRSKFERALALLEAHRAALALNLTAEERRTLEAYAVAADSPHGRRARALLAWDEGRPAAEIGRQCGLSAGRVRYWARAFRQRRLGIFPPVAATEPAAAAAGLAVPAVPPAEIETAGRPAPAPLAANRIRTVRRLCETYGVDLLHARRVADHATQLFDLLRPAHKLPGKRRRLLRDAALLNTIAAGPAAGGRSGRDLILAAPLRGLSMTGRLALACTVALNAESPPPADDPTWLALDESLRHQVRLMAALIRVAEALDASRTQSTAIQSCAGPEGPLCRITLKGSAAATDAERAGRAADLWQRLVGQRLVFEALPVAEAAAAGATGPVGMPSLPVYTPPAATDSMAEAGCKILALHFGRMLANEEGTRLGEDPEALHDMRVATRRMRAAFALFAPYYEPKALKSLGKGLRRTGRTLGAVRDLDVLIGKARAYSEHLAAEGHADLTPLLEAWTAERTAARGQMLAYLDGPAYRRFVDEFAAFLAAPPTAAVAPTTSDQVRHVVPRLILERYEAVRAFERLLPAADLAIYHALRIECKGLRYALEFFREVLSEEASALIKQVTAMQDLLGELQDARVAEELLKAFLAARREPTAGREDAAALAGVEAYLAAQHSRQAELLAAFPAPWAELIGPEFRRRLVLAIAAL